MAPARAAATGLRAEWSGGKAATIGMLLLAAEAAMMRPLLAAKAAVTRLPLLAAKAASELLLFMVREVSTGS